MDYKQKYLKYKQKYLKLLKDQKGGEPFLSDILTSLVFSWLFAKNQRHLELFFFPRRHSTLRMPSLGNITLNHKLRLSAIARGSFSVELAKRFVKSSYYLAKLILSRVNKVQVISDPTCVATLPGHINGVTSVAFHPWDNVMATGIGDNTVKLWRLSADCTLATCVAILPGPISLTGSSNSVTSVTFHPIDKILAIGYTHNIATVLHMSDDYTRVKYNELTFVGHRDSVSSVAFHPREQEPLLATGSWDNTVKLWRLNPPTWRSNPPTCVATLIGHSGNVSSVAFHPIEHVLATGSGDRTAKLWRMSTDCTVAWCVATLTGHSRLVTSVAFHPRLHIMATGSEDNTVKLWRLSANCDTATCVATLDHSIGGHDQRILSIAFHPSLPFLATGSDDDTAKVWLMSADGMAATCIATLRGHRITVSSVAFHPREKVLATGSRDGTTKLWK